VERGWGTMRAGCGERRRCGVPTIRSPRGKGPKGAAARASAGEGGGLRRRRLRRRRLRCGGQRKGFKNGTVYGFALSGEDAVCGDLAGRAAVACRVGRRWSMCAPVPGAGEWRLGGGGRESVAPASLGAVECLTMVGRSGRGDAAGEGGPGLDLRRGAGAWDFWCGKAAWWVAGREGVLFAGCGRELDDAGELYVRNINSIYYDEAAERIVVTSNGPATKVFDEAVATLKVSASDTGWNLRIRAAGGRPYGGATLLRWDCGAARSGGLGAGARMGWWCRRLRVVVWGAAEIGKALDDDFSRCRQFAERHAWGRMGTHCDGDPDLFMRCDRNRGDQPSIGDLDFPLLGSRIDDRGGEWLTCVDSGGVRRLKHI